MELGTTNMSYCGNRLIDEAIYLSNRIIVMSPRPGRITETINISTSYPRNRAGSDFADLRSQLLKRLNFAKDV